MLTCLAFAAVLAGGPLPIPDLAREVETDARALSAQSEVSPAFLAALDDFSTDAMALSDALRAAGVVQDLPCIFRGISEDAHARIAEFQAADEAAERDEALTGLRVLLSDAILLAPMAVREAEGRTEPGDHSAAAAQSITPSLAH